MTYSFVAYDPVLGQAGVATASGGIAVGARVPWARHGVGAVATQAYTNPALGPLVLYYLEKAYTAEEALKKALEHDPSPAHRQVAVVDYRGDVAVHDGEWSPAWHGYTVHPEEPVVCIANLVKSGSLCEKGLNAYMNAKGGLADRLLAALEAAHRAGGDRRGDRSAALLVVGQTEHTPYYDHVVDLRVDYSSDPISELKKLYMLYLEGY